MTLHSIPLGPAWTWLPDSTRSSRGPRFNLPLAPDRLPPSPGRFVRRFQLLPLPPDVATVHLELDDSPGVLSVLLDGQPVPFEHSDSPTLRVLVPDLSRPRSVEITLVYSPPPLPQVPWGRVRVAFGPASADVEPADQPRI